MPGQLIRPSQWWMIDLQPNPIPPSPSSEIDHTLFPSCPSHLPPLMSEKSLSRVCAQPPPPHIHHRRHHSCAALYPSPHFRSRSCRRRGARPLLFFQVLSSLLRGGRPSFQPPAGHDTTRQRPPSRARAHLIFFPHGRPPACSSLVSLSAGETWTRPQWAMAMTPMPPPWPR